jgi:4-amino-4-deoxy-L-arabinose transferase-like glycosyltransferase
MPFWKTRKFFVAFIVLASLVVHAWAIRRLPEDFDEPVYLGAAVDYGRAIRAGDLQKVIDYPGVREHPALGKLIFSIPFVSGELEKDSRWAIIFARSASAFFGTLTIGLVAFIDPVAGILLVFHSIFTKYTSLAMLDALPTFTSLAAVLALIRYKPEKQRWLWVSAAALGLTIAGKYTFAVVIIPILVVFLRRRDISIKKFILYALVALLVFWCANPTLWHDPIKRILAIVAYHNRYSHGEDVTRANFPWYQPIVWLVSTVRLHPSVFLYPYLDPLISAAALIGLYFERKQRLWLVAWIIAGVIILLVWPTKWPHYTLLISAPLCLAAATMLRKMWVSGARQTKKLLLSWNPAKRTI